MKGDKNLLNIPKTIKYIKEQKKKRYYPYYGLEIYVGRQGSRKNTNCNMENKTTTRNVPRSNIHN